MNRIFTWLQEKIMPQAADPSTATALSNARISDVLANSGAALVVYKISNGYLARASHPSTSGVMSPFHYCADHQAISDYIITQFAKDKMGVGAQQNLWDHATLTAKNAATQYSDKKFLYTNAV